MAHRRQRAFTLVELLVVISIIGMLMALVLPAVQKAKESARQTICQNNMGQLAKAHIGFHAHNLRFCGYANSLGVDAKAASWVVAIFPYIDKSDLYEIWAKRPFQNNNHPHTNTHPHVRVETVECPSDPPDDPKRSPMSYAVNGGAGHDGYPNTVTVNGRKEWDENKANGVFHCQYPAFSGGNFTSAPYDGRTAHVVTQQYLQANDGASNTMMLTENVQWVDTWRTLENAHPRTLERERLAVVWWNQQHTAFFNFPTELRPPSINKGKKDQFSTSTPDDQNKAYARPSSFHAQGVNMAFCDGHVKFVGESVDYTVYQQLCTSASSKADFGGGEFPQPEPPPLDDSTF